jgi:pimeloyl-ACP methyl ester carboxylesterase
MAVARVLGAELYYERHGEGPALLFAHGVGGNSLSWWQQVPYFRDRYTCITIDQPGFGRSGEPEGDAWTFADCLASLLDLLEIERVRLVAQSTGGRTCMGYARRYPERVAALVMAGTLGPIELPGLSAWYAEAIEIRAQLRARGVHPACGERMAAERPALQFLYQQIGGLNQRFSAVNRPPGWLRIPDVTPAELGDFRVPTLFTVGEEDPIMPPWVMEQGAAAVPGARLARFPLTGHSVYFERPDQWNWAIDEFLATT